MRAPSRTAVQAFASGVLTVNSVGHLATAAAGKSYLTPLAGPGSGPAVNALWGALSIAGGLVLLRRTARPGRRWGGELHAFNAGAAVFGAWSLISDRFLIGNADD